MQRLDEIEGVSMALFTDGPASNIEDLTAQDSQLSERGELEGIDVTRKLALAQEESGSNWRSCWARRHRSQPIGTWW